jgi:predicted phage-related endonuclease
VLEVKTSSGRVFGLWDDNPAVYAQVQLQHYLMLGFSWGVIAVLIAGSDFRYWQFDRHERFVTALKRREVEWWEKYVLADQMPEVRAEDVRLVDEVFAPRAGVEVLLPPESELWDAQREQSLAEIKKWTAVKHEMEAKLKTAMAGAETGLLPEGGGYRLKDISRKGYAVEPTTYRELRKLK